MLYVSMEREDSWHALCKESESERNGGCQKYCQGHLFVHCTATFDIADNLPLFHFFPRSQIEILGLSLVSFPYLSGFNVTELLRVLILRVCEQTHSRTHPLYIYYFLILPAPLAPFSPTARSTNKLGQL